MIYFRNTTDFYMAGPTAVTLGKFDGVHKGHQKLIRRILALQEQPDPEKRTGGPEKRADGPEEPDCAGKQAASTADRGEACSVSAVAFAVDARAEDRILTDEEQKQVLDDMGLSCLVRCPFVPEISHLSPEAFVKNILLEKLHVKYVVVGTDFRFGYQRAGDAAFLKECGEKMGFHTEIIEKEKYNGREISSSYIREALQEGDVSLASELLGRPYSIGGTVIHGQHLGTRLGMPTANLIPPAGKLLPRNGVYVTVTHLDGQDYPSVTNIGTKPTVDGKVRGVETYLFDTDRNIYGNRIRVSLHSFLRPERKFASLEELKNQLQKDFAAGRRYFSE